MRKNVSMKVAIPVMLGVLILMVVLKSFGLITFRSGIRIGFAGNDGIHKFNGSYTKISGSMSHNLRPSKDSTAIHCEITTKSGDLHVLITQTEDEKVVCDKVITGNETFDISAEGKVKIKINTEGHSGSYLFEY